MQAKIKATAILQDPVGVWEEDFPVEFGPGEAQATMLQLLGMLRGGLMRVLGETEIEFIGPARIVSLNLKMEVSRIDLATTLPQQPHKARFA
jgi:hypothetical protein